MGNDLADDSTLTAALLDRLWHHAHIVQVSGQTYQLKDKLKSGSWCRENGFATAINKLHHHRGGSVLLR